MGKSSPSPPDPVATANAQAGANKEAIDESAKVNRTSTVGPLGTTGWIDTDGDGIPDQQVTTPSAPIQNEINQRLNLASTLNGVMQGIGDSLGSINLSPDSLPPINANFGDATNKAQDAVFQREMALLKPVQAQQQRDLEDRLAVTGNPNGAEGNQLERNRLGTQQNEQDLAAARDAVTAGNALQAQEFGQQMATRQNAAAERLTPYQVLMSLLSGTPPPSVPQAQQPAQYQVQPPDIAGLTQAGYNTASNNAASNNASTTALIGSVISAAASAF